MELLYVGYHRYGYGYAWDPTYILVLIGLLLTLGASLLVKATYARYKNERCMSGLTGAQAAERILRGAGIMDVRIQHISGDLTDNYNPSTKVLSLSDSVYNSSSVAAVGVAAHECGHAIQHEKEYAPIKARTALVPIVNFASGASWPIILIGAFMSWNQVLITLGIILFSASVLFSLVTLPVEFDASRRALKILDHTGMLSTTEVGQARKVLGAAALTYVASAAAMILQLLRVIMIFGGDKKK